DGLASLSGRGYVHVVDDDLILLITEGEHRRTGAAYNHKISRVLPDGRISWTIRARPVGEPVRWGSHLLLPVAPVPPRFEHEERPALQLQVRDPETGALLASFPVYAPDPLRAAYRRAARGLGARLVPAAEGV